MIKGLVIATICILSVSAGPKYHQLEGYSFEQYIQDFNKPHMLGSSEYVNREQIFNDNLASIKQHNSEEHSWKQGVNKFTDMTTEELNQFSKGNSKNMRLGQSSQSARFLEESYENRAHHVPKSFDWREHGVVTPVKDQSSCGSCWAFATTETVESQAAVNSGKLIELSPQQVTSCVTNGLQCGGTGGCSGAIAQLGFTYIELFGITTEEEYPYKSANMTSYACAFNASSMSKAVSIMGHRTLPFNDEDVLIDALLVDGPIAISVDASNWHSYEEGIFNGCSYEANIDLDHAVQLVGYTPDYFIVRNSWTEAFGEYGYIRLERSEVAKCGIDSTPLDGAACVNDGQVEQVVCGMCGMFANSATTIGAKLN